MSSPVITLPESLSVPQELKHKSYMPHPIHIGTHTSDYIRQSHNGFYQYFYDEIFPQIVPPPYGSIEIEQLSMRKRVYCIKEQTQNLEVVVKTYKQGINSFKDAWRCAEREYFNLQLLRNKLGMDRGDCRVVQPLGKNKHPLSVLVTEKVNGELFDSHIARAVHEQQHQQLFQSLSLLAHFFSELHHNGMSNKPVSSNLSQQYLAGICNSLNDCLMDAHNRYTIERLAGRWLNKDGVFSGDTDVVVHGDATPTNFFIDEKGVIAIDLERMKLADRCWDIGFIAAELKHHFMWRAGDRWAAEPYIGHFLWNYAVNCKDSQFFHYLTNKLPLYMALGLLRIARNNWLDVWYRKELIAEATRCLKYGL